MQRIGETIRPELGQVNYGGYLAGAQQGAAALGRGLAKAGDEVGDMLKRQGESKKETAAAQKMFSAMSDVYGPDSKIGQVAGRMSMDLQNEDIPLSQRHAAASAGSNILNMMLHKAETDIAHGFQERQMQVAEGGLGLQKQEAQSRAAMIRQNMAQESNEKAGRALGYQFLSEMGGGAEAGLLPSKGNKMEAIRETMAGLPPDAAAAFGKVLSESDAFENDVEFKPVEMMAPDPRTGQVVPSKAMVPHVNGVPQMDRPVAGSVVPKGRTYASPKEKTQEQYRDAMFKRQQSSIDEAAGAADRIFKAQKAISLMDAGTYTGAGAEALAWWKSVGEVLGVETDVANYQELRNLLSEGIKTNMAATKGAISEKEMEMFEAWAANVKNTPEGNRRILELSIAIEKRKMKMAEMFKQGQRDGIDPAALEQQVEDAVTSWGEASPIFGTLADGAEPGRVGGDRAALLRAINQD